MARCINCGTDHHLFIHLFNSERKELTKETKYRILCGKCGVTPEYWNRIYYVPNEHDRWDRIAYDPEVHDAVISLAHDLGTSKVTYPLKGVRYGLKLGLSLGLIMTLCLWWVLGVTICR